MENSRRDSIALGCVLFGDFTVHVRHLYHHLVECFLGTIINSPWKWASGYKGPREAVAFRGEGRPQNNIVFIVDESVRGDHLSVNGYTRKTTPYLDDLAQRGLLQT